MRKSTWLSIATLTNGAFSLLNPNKESLFITFYILFSAYFIVKTLEENAAKKE